MERPPVLAVLVAHASGSWLDEALASLGRVAYPDLQVLIVTVGEVRIPDGVIPARRVRGIVELPAGTGYAQAVNEAVAAGRGDEPYLLLLHDDVAPEPDAVERLVERLEEDPELAAVGAKLLEWDDGNVLQEVGGSIDRFAIRRTGLEEQEVDHGQHDDASDVLFCSSACLLVRRSDFDAVAGFDPEAWPLYDDVDLCWRLRAGGRRVVVEPRARARHAAGLSRGMRRAGGPAFGALGVRRAAERGRLRFMLKNYAGLSLAVILPQYAVLAFVTVLSGLVRREFWRLRAVGGGAIQVARELPHVLDARRRAGPRRVEDQELLRLSARRAVADRRYERVALAGRIYESVRRSEEQAVKVLREPMVWAGVAAVVVLLVTLRGVLFGGSFTLGELRRIPGLGDALSSYTTRRQVDGFDPYGPGTPGLVALGALRWLALGSSALAEKIALLAPLVVAAFGARRLGRLLHLGDRGRSWLWILTVVNPATLVLVREGSVGALVSFAATMWLAALFLAPPGGLEERRDRIRRRARWALAWILVVALHPPALVWLTLLGVGLAVARHGDDLTGRRRALLVTGIAGALLGLLPWSLQWFTVRTPLVGPHGGFLAAPGGGLDALTFGGGWPLVAWVVAALAATYLVGLTRTTLMVTLLLAAVWAAGAAGVYPRHSALAAVGWSTLALFGFAGRRISDELSRYALGWRHALVIGLSAVVAVGWGGAAVAAVADGTDARHLDVVPAADQARVGRVLWVSEWAGGTLFWATDGFEQRLHAFPVPHSPGERLVAGALDAARRGQTHRLGAVLALADVSHVVALQPPARAGLAGQADLSPSEVQAGAVLYRNEAWRGQAMLLSAPPRDVLSPAGLADLVRAQRRVDADRVSADEIRVQLPEDAEGFLYLAGGARDGWAVAGGAATADAAGVWLDARDLDARVTAEPPGELFQALYPLQAAIVLLLVLVWLAAVYLTGPEGVRPRPPADVDLRAMAFPRGVAYVPLLLIAVAGWLAWAQPVRAEAGRFLSSAWYCPPPGNGYRAKIGIVNPSRGQAEYLVRPRLDGPPAEAGKLRPGERATLDVDPASGHVVESYGNRVVVGSVVSRERTASSLCASEPRDVSFFAEGGRAALRARPRLFEAYVLYNPFPELARASVRFFGDDQAVSPPDFQDIRVPPGQSVTVDPETQFFFPLDLSTRVEVWQGRAIVARRLRTVEDLTWGLGTGPVESGILPRAATAGAVTELVAVNPAEQPVRVSLTAVGERGSLPVSDFEIDPDGRVSFDLANTAPDEPGLVVRMRASPPVPAEVLVVPDRRSSLSLFPILEPAHRWVVPVAEGRTLFVVNPGNRPVRLRFRVLGDGPPVAAQTVGASRVAQVRLPQDGAFGVEVSADGGPVTVVAASGAGGSAGFPTG